MYDDIITLIIFNLKLKLYFNNIMITKCYSVVNFNGGLLLTSIKYFSSILTVIFNCLNFNNSS